MTHHKFENNLRDRAEVFIKKLLQTGIDIKPYSLTFSDYRVKTSVQDKGEFSIYYRPNIDDFVLVLQDLHDTNLRSKIESCWLDVADDTPQYTEKNERSIYQAFVDGSFSKGRVGYGVTILKHDKEIKRISGQMTEHIELRQVAGEIQATIEVLKWCEKNAVWEMDIFYDYAGIEMWATGAWQANNEMTQHYVRFVQSSNVHVNWRKVKSHTGDFWNDFADKLSQFL